MKFCTLGLIAIICIGFAHCISKDEAMEMAKILVRECQIQEGGSDEDFTALMNLNYPNTKEGNCMVACTHEKMGIVREIFF
jgi:hypothetical protein